jgi:hypothetical protein
MRLYGLVIAFSVFLDIAILRYGRLRHMLGRRGFQWLRPILAMLVLPRISEWHVNLSPILLPSKDLKIWVDVMTKRGTLYSGGLKEKVLSSDGTLQSVTLAEPRRFKYDQYVDARKQNPAIMADDYWRRIPGESFIILGGEIETLNVRHAPDTVRQFTKYRDVLEALGQVRMKASGLSGTSKKP